MANELLKSIVYLSDYCAKNSETNQSCNPRCYFFSAAGCSLDAKGRFFKYIHIPETLKEEAVNEQ